MEKDAADCLSLPSHYRLTNLGTRRTSPAAYPTELTVCSIRIGGDQAEYLALTVNGRERPDASDYWDANWLICTAEVVAGHFRGRLDRSLRTDELERFYQQVIPLYERLSGEAELSTMEGWLTLR